MALKKGDKERIVLHWNSKKIVVHRRLTPDIATEISRICKYYSADEIIEFINFYATILEPGIPEDQQKYFWTYKWNLYEFLKRGVKKFDGQELSNYQKKQTLAPADAIIFTRQ